MYQWSIKMILMSIEELADYLSESKRTIYRYIKTGDCPPYIRITKKNVKFDKRDVDAWLESKKINPADQNPEGEKS
jgi:excisionase family DNA binding protein